MNPLRYTAKKAFDERLNTDGPTHTFARLCTSRHVDDLQGIATIAIAAIAAFLAIVLWQLAHAPAGTATAGSATGANDAKDQIAIYMAALAAAAGVVSWAYQAGSRRLGAVDLFASEIGAICRVCLIVDFANVSIRLADEGMPDAAPTAAPHPTEHDSSDKFTSEEKYTPVYDNNISELQSLDFDVVKSVTNFYTYRKTMMDFMRKIAVTPCSKARTDLQKKMIYMQFLMYESGREAVAKLIEFDPDRSECLINILCSELPLFGFLLNEHDGDFQGDRLKLRLPLYDKLVAKLDRKVERHHHEAWDRARTTQPELLARYETMLRLVSSPVVPPSPNDNEKQPMRHAS